MKTFYFISSLFILVLSKLGTYICLQQPGQVSCSSFVSVQCSMKCLQSSCRRLGKECKQQQEWIYSFSAPCILFSQMYGRIYREEPWSLGDVTNLAKVSKTTTTFCSCICCSHQFSPEYQSLTTSHCIPLSSLHCVSTFCCCLAGYPWLVFLYL